MEIVLLAGTKYRHAHSLKGGEMEMKIIKRIGIYFNGIAIGISMATLLVLVIAPLMILGALCGKDMTNWESFFKSGKPLS
jgi:hypothetical protein